LPIARGGGLGKKEVNIHEGKEKKKKKGFGLERKGRGEEASSWLPSKIVSDRALCIGKSVKGSVGGEEEQHNREEGNI